MQFITEDSPNNWYTRFRDKFNAKCDRLYTKLLKILRRNYMNVTTIDEKKQVVNLWNIIDKKYRVLPFHTINVLYRMINKIPPYDDVDYSKHIDAAIDGKINMNIKKAPYMNETIQHILEDYKEELKHLTEEQRKTFIKQCEEKILQQPEKTNAH